MMSRLVKRVEQQKTDLSQKVQAYGVCIVSTLMDCSETWKPYSYHEKIVSF